MHFNNRNIEQVENHTENEKHGGFRIQKKKKKNENSVKSERGFRNQENQNIRTNLVPTRKAVKKGNN